MHDKSEKSAHINTFRIHISLALCKLMNYKCICWSSHLNMQKLYLFEKKSTRVNEAIRKIFNNNIATKQCENFTTILHICHIIFNYNRKCCYGF